MGFLVSSQAFDDSYFKNILLSPLFLVVYSLFFALFVGYSAYFLVRSVSSMGFIKSFNDYYYECVFSFRSILHCYI